MRHADRWDLPKGHVDAGETNLQCALRELVEETGILQTDLIIDPSFRFLNRYVVQYKTGPPKQKLLLIFLAELTRDVDIQLTEHIGYEWFPWSPPHQIQSQTIDPLLAQVAAHWPHPS